MDKKKHVLILGGTGFLGSEINKYFLKSKGYKVDNISSKEIDLRKEELSIDLTDLYHENSSIIFLSAVKRHLGDSINTYRMNTQIGVTVSKALEKKPVKDLIYLSSCAGYGEKNNQENYREDSSINPTSFYGASKISNEMLLKLMKNNSNIKNLSILRPTTIYGNININTYCPSGFVGKSIKGKKIELWGNGEEKRDFFNVDNFVEVISFLLEKPTNITLNLVTGSSFSFNDLTKIICNHIQGIQIINKPRTNPVVNHYYNSEKILKTFSELKIKTPSEWINEFFDNYKGPNKNNIFNN